MNTCRLRAAFHDKQLSNQIFAVRARLCWRTYATHREPVVPSSLLSQVLDQKRGAARREDNVGPFQLGLVPPTPEEVGDVKKWSELSPGGKVARATARTSNLTVILFGAGLSAMLIYAVTSELFSRNSPTVLFNEACESIKASSRVAKYLPPPLIFHNHPPSAVRPRHRNHQVSSQVVLDAAGREHLLLNFYVQSHPSDSALFSARSSHSYFHSVYDWVKDRALNLSDLSWDQCVSGAKESAASAVQSSQRLFRYLTGKPEPSARRASAPNAEPEENGKEEKSGLWSVAGLFGGLRNTLGTRSEEGRSHAGGDGKMWTDGEVHADLVRDNDGYFQFRYILIDIPNSRSRNPVRVFVERSSDVRENEPVLRWDS